MENFTPIASLMGGMLIGLSALGMLALSGRIAGVSGITGGLIGSLVGAETSGRGWRIAFFLGLVMGGVFFFAMQPDAFAIEIERSLGALAVAGVLVGFGTRMGAGCTSGHGVCGVSRFSRRSLVATGMFLVSGAATVAVVNRVFGGVL